MKARWFGVAEQIGDLGGFALTGAAVREKGDWTRQVPARFDNRD